MSHFFEYSLQNDYVTQDICLEYIDLKENGMQFITSSPQSKKYSPTETYLMQHHIRVHNQIMRVTVRFT